MTYRFLLIILIFSFLSCNNQPGQQKLNEKEIKAKPNAKKEVHSDPHLNSHSDPHSDSHVHTQSHSHDYLYKSDNGEIFDVTFFEKDNKMQVKIQRKNKEELVLNQTTAWSKGAEYENGDFKWTSRNNDGTFSYGKKSMNLVVISPLQYTFTNNKEDISVTYFSKFDKRFVNIQKDNNKNVTLEQTSAWAKGADYGTGEIKWRGNGEEGTLIEDGVESKYHQKD